MSNIIGWIIILFFPIIVGLALGIFVYRYKKRKNELLRREEIAFRAMHEARQDRLDRIEKTFEDDRLRHLKKSKPFIKLSSRALSDIKLDNDNTQ